MKQIDDGAQRAGLLRLVSSTGELLKKSFSCDYLLGYQGLLEDLRLQLGGSSSPPGCRRFAPQNTTKLWEEGGRHSAFRVTGTKSPGTVVV